MIVWISKLFRVVITPEVESLEGVHEKVAFIFRIFENHRLTIIHVIDTKV